MHYSSKDELYEQVLFSCLGKKEESLYAKKTILYIDKPCFII